MNYLLDTQVLIWLFENDSRLKKVVVNAVTDPSNTIYVSKVSLFEIAIKQTIGKLHIKKTPEQIVKDLEQNSFSLLDIEINHFSKYVELPLHHRDPFDRLLVAQAQSENFIFISDDEQLAKYNVQIILQ